MAIQGKVDITLTDVNTGKKKEIKGKNTFMGQNIAKYLRSLGMNGNVNTGNKSNYNLWKHTVGGLFLFSDEITEGSEYMPAGNTMVGAGVVDMAHTGAPSEWGSFNANESSATLNGITQVYDFTTDQANGNISSVCLTSRMGAQIGYGHNGDNYLWSSSPYDIGSEQSIFSTDYSQSPQGWIYKNSDGTEWEMLRKGSASSYYPIYEGKLYVTKKRYGIGKLSVFDSFEKELSFDLTGIGTNPLGITSSSYGEYQSFPYGGSKFIICPRPSSASPGQPSTIAANGKIYYYILDMEVETLNIVEDFTNTTGVTIRNSANGRCAWSITPDDCMIVVKDSSPYTMYKIKLTGTNKGQIVKIFNSETPVIGFAGSYMAPADGSHGQYIVPGLELFCGYGISDNKNGFVYDTVNDTLKRINCNPFSGSYVYNSDFDVMQRNLANLSGAGNGYWLANNPLYLATIYNLETPVQKTAAQTMKVTYTLTEVSE